MDTGIQTPSIDDASTTRDPMMSADTGDPLGDAGREASESVGQIASRAADLGLQRADQGKDQAAQTISRLAGSMRQVSTDLQGEQPQIAGVARTAAEQAERLASYMERTDARQIISTVEDAARRQPLLFLGGAFAIGLIASRVLKAGSRPDREIASYGYPNGYRTADPTLVGSFDGRTTRGS
jgi:ABC-type transporter Mla subunit MlaD